MNYFLKSTNLSIWPFKAKAQDNYVRQTSVCNNVILFIEKIK